MLMYTKCSEEELVCRVGTVLAGGLVQKWTPTPHKVEPPKEKPGSRKSGLLGSTSLCFITVCPRR